MNYNGIGIPEDMDWRHAESLGLRLVISLVEQLDSTIELDRGNEVHYCNTIWCIPEPVKIPKGTWYGIMVAMGGTGSLMYHMDYCLVNFQVSDKGGVILPWHLQS
ncbi:MAG: hypothetical protein Q8N94_00310 [Methanoregula sp.]|nr:hypothetical protein [Methanoregula sp.]